MLCLLAGKWKQPCDFPSGTQDEQILAEHAVKKKKKKIS